MASRIIATFSGRDVKSFGPGFQALLPAMLPYFNAIAGETVFVDDSGEDVLILASYKPETPADLPDFRTFYIGRSGFTVFPCPLGTPLDQVHAALADALADYADEIRRRSGC